VDSCNVCWGGNTGINTEDSTKDCNDECGGSAVVDCNDECGGAGTDVAMGGGSWISETSWSITSCDGSIIASGDGIESTSCVDLPSDYIVTMTDSYGDGWNGNVLNIGETVYDGPSADLLGDESALVIIGACVLGCMDATACNYNADATYNDGTCEFAAEGFDCDGNSLFPVVPGCTDAFACNYNADATDDDGTCEFAAEGFDCDGNPLCAGTDGMVCTVPGDMNGDSVINIQDIVQAVNVILNN
jgi:hypothetical protein